MEIMEEDRLIAFIDYANSILWNNNEETNGAGWSWIASRILKSCISYSSGVTSAILLSDLSQAWNEQNRSGGVKEQPDLISELKRKHRRLKLPNTVSIDSIYEKKFLSLTSVIEAVILDAFLLPATNIYMLTLGDLWSSNTIHLYLHRRFYNLAHPSNGILTKGRQIFLTGCYLRTAAGGVNRARLLPTEYLVMLLDEDQDDDAILLAAQFCSDSLSSVSLDAVNRGVSYSLYARIECIGAIEVQGRYASLQKKQITLVDNDGVRLKFLLWGEQVVLANLFSVGSMLALDRPYVASFMDSSHEGREEICLEYGSETQLYLVPLIQHEERVFVPSTQNRSQASRVNGSDPTQGLRVSQVTLPCDSRGSIDFSRYPFRSYVTDIRDKMTGISLYGTIRNIFREESDTETIFSLKIEDTTGAVWAKLHFVGSWSLGRVGLGHTVYISGMTCSRTKQKILELSWLENDSGTSFINISGLPAILNSSCLHKLSRLSDLLISTTFTHVCQVWLDQIDQVNTRFSHVSCGQLIEEAPDGGFRCDFCDCSCNMETSRTFHLKITLADESTKVLAWCTGQTATELLQISPDEFDGLPEEEQIMYPSCLQHDRFTVMIVNCSTQSSDEQISDTVAWEVTCAMKCDW
ncbi:hypothetical protein LIER_30641 [Lithospermum erythrorhizon]|uniref:Nucleic acid-binding protein n=1 Tax=Lithospermum erythrorhizon TaxID=34254 RepID=A0AAV3RQC0_LITER